MFKKTEKTEKTINTKLFVRILPSTDFHYDSIKIETNRQVLYVRCLQDLSKGVKIKNPNYWYFCTDGVFWNSCQSEVYEAVTAGLYDELFEGARAIIISYGQTGSGKTFTTSGLRYPFQKRGLILRVLSQLFEEKEARRDVTKICLGMSYLEFNGQLIKDLICNKALKHIGDVVEYKIPNEVWAWRQIFKAEANKAFNASAPYAGSHRGHSVLSFYIHAESLVDSDPVIKHSKIHIVDMGGIDNVGNKQSSWRHKIDVCNSNLSKTLMEQLLIYYVGSPSKRKHQICPYKTNRLLTYLHDTINDKCLLRFVAHIYGNQENIPVTLSTLRFGEKIRLMRPTKLERIYETTRDLEIRNMTKDYMRLKNEVTLNHMFKDPAGDLNISQERIQEIKRAAEAFLFGQLEDLTLFSLGQAHITLNVFKDIYQSLVKEKDQMVKDAVIAATEKIQAQMLEKSSIPSEIPSNQKISRRRSRQTESQTSFGASNKSSDSIQNAAKSGAVVQQAGATDKKGISIGPPKKVPSTFEGNVTKAFKKLRSRKSETAVLKGMKSGTTREFGVVPYKNLLHEDSSKISFGPNLPPRETLWNVFTNEKVDVYTEMNHKVEAAEDNVREAKRNYLRTLADLAKLREEIENCRIMVEKCQHIRQVYGKGDNDDENSGPGELEATLIEALAQKEESLNTAVENCHVALTDLRNALEEMKEIKHNLEYAFQNFCNENYKIVYPPEEEEEDSQFELVETKKFREDEDEDSVEMDTKNQPQMELYAQLQEKLLNDMPKPVKTGRKPWITLF